MSQDQYTKENIKARMLSRAASLWNVRNADNLDPMVRLLVESLASEVFKLAGELDDVEDRVVEKLARTFTPSFMMAASPAHAIVHACAVSNTCDISTSTEFSYKEPGFLQKHGLVELIFTPVMNMKLFDGEVAAIIAREKFYNVTPQGGKDHVATASRNSLFNSAMWIGLELGNGVQNLKDLSFYFELPLMDNAVEYFHLLRYLRLSHNGTEIAAMPGIPERDDDIGQNFFGFYDPRRQMSKDIADKYQRQYITICEELSVRDLKKEIIPAEIAHLFSKEFINGFSHELVWVKVSFPPAFDDSAIAYLCVHMNCFPIANIFYNKNIRTISPLSSIIPLEKEDKEYFLHVESVTDSRSREYRQIRSHDDNTTAGTYIIRRGGSERFNSANVKNYLERLMDLYRDESTAFSKVDSEIGGTAEEMLSQLGRLDVKLQAYSNNIEHTSYLIFDKNITEKQNITVRYSLSNGAIANGIMAYEGLSIPDVSDIEPASAILMTTTRGGRRSPSESSQKDIYQYLLTSRDRVYTKEDIRLFCKCYFSEYFSDVKVESGYEVSKAPKEGVIKTTNIVLHGTKNENTDPNILVGDMLAALTRRSPEGMNYRIILS